MIAAARMGGWLAVALICAFLLLPTLVVVPMSFSGGDVLAFPPAGLSLRWYRTYLTDPTWREATANSLSVGLMAAAIASVLGTCAAVALVRGRVRFAGTLRALFLLPMVVPTIVTAVASYRFLSVIGLTNTRLGLALAHALLGLPFVVINVSAVLRKADPRIDHAARSLGATPMRAFLHVTAPLIAPGLAAGAVFAFVTSFDEVVVALFLTGIDTVTLPVQMWSGIRFEINPVVAAVSVLMVVVSTGCISLFALFRSRSA